MRTNVTERFYRFSTGQSADRCPDQEFGYWPQTIRRWLKEGMDVDLTPDERNQMFCKKVDRLFGFENLGIAFYEYPDMVHDMVEHLAALAVNQLLRIPSDIPIDFVSYWEDMASKNGPFHVPGSDISASPFVFPVGATRAINSACQVTFCSWARGTRR